MYVLFDIVSINYPMCYLHWQPARTLGEGQPSSGYAWSPAGCAWLVPDHPSNTLVPSKFVIGRLGCTCASEL